MKEGRRLIIRVGMLFSVFLIGALFFGTKTPQIVNTKEKDTKENMIICSNNKESEGALVSKDKKVPRDTDKGVIVKENSNSTDNIQWKIEILPNPGIDNMNIITLPVPGDMKSTYLDLHKNNESSEKER